MQVQELRDELARCMAQCSQASARISFLEMNEIVLRQAMADHLAELARLHAAGGGGTAAEPASVEASVTVEQSQQTPTTD